MDEHFPNATVSHSIPAAVWEAMSPWARYCVLRDSAVEARRQEELRSALTKRNRVRATGKVPTADRRAGRPDRGYAKKAVSLDVATFVLTGMRIAR